MKATKPVQTDHPTDYVALVLAAGREHDPLALHYHVSHKCKILIGGIPMLARVLDALADTPRVSRVIVSIDKPHVANEIADKHGRMAVQTLASSVNAPASVTTALNSGLVDCPVLVTTGDHALLSVEMLDHFLSASAASNADLTIALARREIIETAYPNIARTYFTFGADRVSGCNLFALNTAKAFKAVAFWSRVDRDRKRPWSIIRAFGFYPLLLRATGRLTLEGAFARASRKLDAVIKPVIMPFAEAAIDVDKRQDKSLVEDILAGKTQNMNKQTLSRRYNHESKTGPA
ncbi:MAG: nucleotidyltransferase family protein [Hyphomicrobiales bacterium]